jgi:hypothetical protein
MVIFLVQSTLRDHLSHFRNAGLSQFVSNNILKAQITKKDKSKNKEETHI